MSVETTSNSAKPIYFSGFNGVRALAAFAVVIHHVGQIKENLRPTSIPEDSIVKSLGDNGVDVFFVLSGFLISYMLLSEEKLTSTINLKNFYLRRAFLILPLYYLIVLIAFSFVPNLYGGYVGSFMDSMRAQRDQSYWSNLAFYLAMLPNISILLFPPVIFASQAWSVGVEEQFYLLWPLILKRFGKQKWIPMLSVAILKICLVYLLANFARTSLVFRYFVQFKLEFMAIGGLFAYVLHAHADLVDKYLTPTIAKFCAAPIIVLLLMFGDRLPFPTVTFPILCAWALLNLQCSPYVFLNLETETFGFLGKISYGIYMYHLLAVMAVIRIAGWLLLFHAEPWILDSFLVVGSISLSVAISALSYRYFETPFLKMKDRFSVVPSSVLRPEYLKTADINKRLSY